MPEISSNLTFLVETFKLEIFSHAEILFNKYFRFRKVKNNYITIMR